MDANSYPANDRTTLVTIAAKGDATPVVSGDLLELDLTKFHSGRWAAQLDVAVARRAEPIVLLASGVVCLAVAWWAKLSPKSYMTNVRGAIFASPLHVGFGQAAIAAAAGLSPAIKLPFPAIVTSRPSPIIGQVLALADSWGAHFVDVSVATAGRPTNRRGPAALVEQRLNQLLDILNSDVRAHAPVRAEAAVAHILDAR